MHDRLAQLRERRLVHHIEPGLGQVVQAMAGVFDPKRVDDLGTEVMHAFREQTGMFVTVTGGDR